jgi:hypothetical protein
MKFQIDKSGGGQCGFELFDNNKKDVCSCGVKGTVLVNHKHLCWDHLKIAVANDKRPTYFNEKGKEILYTKTFFSVVRSSMIESNKED